MAWYRIAENVLDAIANAINAKTGHTAPMTPVEMVSEIQSIPTGGGSLPQNITKISSGTFTFASSTKLDVHIPHDLGETPKFVLCWTDDLEANDSGNGMITGSLSNQPMYENATTLHSGYRGIAYRFSSIQMENLAGFISNLSNILGEDYFCFSHGARTYKTGVTYKWIAIA